MSDVRRARSSSGQAQVLEQLYVGYLEMNRMKSLARAYGYWPGMDEL